MRASDWSSQTPYPGWASHNFAHPGGACFQLLLKVTKLSELNHGGRDGHASNVLKVDSNFRSDCPHPAYADNVDIE